MRVLLRPLNRRVIRTLPRCLLPAAPARAHPTLLVIQKSHARGQAGRRGRRRGRAEKRDTEEATEKQRNRESEKGKAVAVIVVDRRLLSFIVIIVCVHFARPSSSICYTAHLAHHPCSTACSLARTVSTTLPRSKQAFANLVRRQSLHVRRSWCRVFASRSRESKYARGS